MLFTLCLLFQGPALTVQPAQAAIGQPLEVTLVFEHAPEAGLTGSGPALELDASWVVLKGPEMTALPALAETRTRVRWSVMSLEPGERVLPGLDLLLADGSTLSVEGAALAVGAELDAEEDAPRPLPGMQGVLERTGALRLVHLGWMFLALLVAGVLIVWWRKRRGVVGDPGVQGEWARFAALKQIAANVGQGTLHEAGGAQDVSAELAALLRSAAQHKLSVLRPGQADGEWLERMRGEGENALADELTPLLETCERIRFGGLQPTRFALDELLQSSEVVLARLAPDAPTLEGARA